MENEPSMQRQQQKQFGRPDAHFGGPRGRCAAFFLADMAPAAAAATKSGAVAADAIAIDLAAGRLNRGVGCEKVTEGFQVDELLGSPIDRTGGYPSGSFPAHRGEEVAVLLVATPAPVHPAGWPKRQSLRVHAMPLRHGLVFFVLLLLRTILI